MSPLPTRMTDHWAIQPGTDPQHRQLMWPVTLGADRTVIELTRQAHRRLAGIPGLDLVPPRWLHLTTLTSGPADAIAPGALAAMIEEAQHLLAAITPITITLSRVLYHPRAVMLDAGPAEPFKPVIEAIQTATRHARSSTVLYHDPWRPHITLAYSNGTQPAAPVIEALGRSLPARQVTIRSVSLVTQSPGQRWTWDLIANLPLAAAEFQQRHGDARCDRLDDPRMAEAGQQVGVPDHDGVAVVAVGLLRAAEGMLRRGLYPAQLGRAVGHDEGRIVL